MALREAQRLAQDVSLAGERAFAFQIGALQNFGREALRIALAGMNVGWRQLTRAGRLASGIAVATWENSAKLALQEASKSFGTEAGKRAAQAVALSAVVEWIANNSAWLQSLFSNPTMISVVRYLSSLI
ncbi:MAG: hypothetical protein KIT25_05435 [Enhydrobacter sp.]|nr:MAG: hypothetical protein KIT25_05435 [Enhydrobacter sp.]